MAEIEHIAHTVPSRGPMGSLLAPPVRTLDGLADDTPLRPLDPKPPRVFNPLLRLLFCVILFPVAGILAGLLVTVIFGPPLGNSPRTAALLAGAQIFATVLAYLVLVLLIERRRPPLELVPRRLLGVLVGLLLGMLFLALAFLVAWGFGAYQIVGVGHPRLGPWWAMTFAVGAGAGIAEEILFRGVLFRLSEEFLGTWAAALLSGLIFGLVHLTNRDATLLGAIAIFLEAGISFALFYALTRSLWLVMGIHAGWNILQGPVLGIIVSGTGASNGLLVTQPHGPTWLSGGSFGLESSVLAIAVMVIITILAGVLLQRRRLAVAPMWVRRRRQREQTLVTAAPLAPAGGPKGHPQLPEPLEN